jgi:phosphopantothenoylcysteine decarboxylase/phosphopantothenate--cysteine ligase
MDDALAQDAQLRRIVLGVTGGIAAYKSAELVRLLVKDGVAVDVVLTDAGARFVTATTFQALSGRPVAQSLWHSDAGNAMGHIGPFARRRSHPRGAPPPPTSSRA